MPCRVAAWVRARLAALEEGGGPGPAEPGLPAGAGSGRAVRRVRLRLPRHLRRAFAQGL